MRLSTFIFTNMEPILQEWENFARSMGSVTSSMDTAALRDHAELMLRAIAADLETPQTAAQQKAKSEGDAPPRPAHLPPSAATSHGEVRAEDGFSLEQMVAEYRALRASVLRLWVKAHALDDPDSFQQLMRFNEAIDEALADSIETYSHAVDDMSETKARHRMEALGTLSAGLGHDMANVLLPMRVCLSGLGPLTPETAPLVDALHRAVEHLSGLTKGLRALSLDLDTSAATSGSVMLAEWWTSAISPFTWALPKGVQLHAEGLASADNSLPPVRVPAHVLMQAVFNLVQNAAHALGQRNAADPQSKPAGKIWITARPEVALSGPSGAESMSVIHLTVRDDGPGMDPETLARCTEAFFTTRAKAQGTGLGLFLVRTVMERHGGKLLVESKAGEGSSFTLVLPVAAD
jgi:signal transduction histidine kinase